MFLLLPIVLLVAWRFGRATFLDDQITEEGFMMKLTIWNRILLVAVIVAVPLVGMSRADKPQGQKQQDTKKQPPGQNKQQRQEAQQQQVQQRQLNQNELQQQQAQQQARQQVQQQAQQQQQLVRVSQKRQQRLILQQQQRMTQYRRHVDQDARLAAQRIARFQQQNRMAQYRFQQQYLERLRQQQLRLQSDRNHDYSSDPYFYTAPNYRYNRGGVSYETNQYGADVLRQAVNYGYADGLQSGRADQADGWRSSYQDSYTYQDASYGYTGYYVDQDAYNYYFREGFRRGYEDGYANRNQYGSSNNGTYSILAGILSGILKLQPLR